MSSTKTAQLRFNDPDTAILVDVVAKTEKIPDDQVFFWTVASEVHSLIDKLEGMQKEQEKKHAN